MAISDRIQSIEEHIKESYQELEGIGIDITGVDKNLENIPKLIDGYWETLPKVTGEGTSITLDNTKEGKMKINLKGNTSQETTTGKNKYNATRSSATTSAVTYSGDTSKIYINGTPNGEGRIFFNKTYLEAGTYTFSMTLSSGSFTNGGNNQTYLYLYKGTEQSASWTYDARVLLTATKDNVVSNTFTIAEGGYYYLAWYCDTRYTWTNAEMKYQVETGNSFTSFEPYTNGASPNPDYPQDVHVVTGDNTIKVEGKNLFDKDNVNILHIHADNNTQSIKRQNNFVTAYFPAKEGETYTMSSSSSLFDNYASIFFTDENPSTATTFLSNTVKASSSVNYVTATSPSRTKYVCFYMIFSTNQTSITSLFETIQIEIGSTASTYEAYNGNTYPINLGTMELCKIGDYQDSIVKDNGKWYVNKQIGKIIFNGNENWTFRVMSGINRFDLVGLNSKSGSAQSNPILCNYFLSKYANEDNVIYLSTNVGALAIMSNNFTNLATFKTWLSNGNTMIYYALQTPTNTEITDTTLISQLETLNGAKSYITQTNINQENNDLPFILDATALKQLTQ